MDAVTRVCGDLPIIQAREIWQQYGSWAIHYLENFGPGIKQRFMIAKEITQEAADQAGSTRAAIQDHLNQTLQRNNLFLDSNCQ
jgi:amidase